MAYSTRLEEKIDAATKRWKSMEKKTMFGGVCWLLKGNMAFGIWKDAPKNVWETRQIKRAVELGLGASKREEIKLVTASVGDNPHFDEIIGKIRSLI